MVRLMAGARVDARDRTASGDALGTHSFTEWRAWTSFGAIFWKVALGYEPDPEWKNQEVLAQFV
jgi:hypothetical protein